MSGDASGETVRLLLPPVEKVEVQVSDLMDGVRPAITVDWSRMPSFCDHLRELARVFDPRDHDDQLDMARRSLERVSMLKHAIEVVLRFYDAGDRGTALHEAVRYLKQTATDVDVI